MKLLDSLKRLLSNQQVRHFSFEEEKTEFSLDKPPLGATIKDTGDGLRLRIRRPRFWPSIMLILVLTTCGLIFNAGLHFEEGRAPILITMGAAIFVFTLALLYNIFGQEEFTVTDDILIRKLGMFGIGIPHKVPLHTIERIGFRHRMPKSGGEFKGRDVLRSKQIDSGRDLSSMRVLMIIGKNDEITVRDLSLAHYDYARFFLQTTIKTSMKTIREKMGTQD